ncbi:unnamed protein product [Moneuplotes crassus]|uniref:Uncharacterized protein n=1 Tax=Euplotes crassus TaxID=5936 RepID=A0AAD1XLL5_EUPCR|nr:unnamed protein product [Moneuplotes crassus]
MSSANKLDSIYSLLTQGLKCPFICCEENSKIAPPTENQLESLEQQLDPEEKDILDNYRIQTGNIINYMLPYVLPTDQRLQLLEWLFEQNEPDIFKADGFLDSDSCKLSNLELACSQFGIKGQTKRSLNSSIQGINGITEAINFLFEVTEVTRQLLLFENLENSQQQIDRNNQLMNFIAGNSNQVFTTEVRLFSPGFLKLDDLQYESKEKLSEAKDSLEQHVDQLRHDYEQLQQTIDKKLAVNATDSDFEALESSLKKTRSCVVEFKQECEAGLRTKLNKINENSLSGVEPLVEQVYEKRQQIDPISSNLRQILATLNELQT